MCWSSGTSSAMNSLGVTERNGQIRRLTDRARAVLEELRQPEATLELECWTGPDPIRGRDYWEDILDESIAYPAPVSDTYVLKNLGLEWRRIEYE